jgi:hypothetical protein
MIYDCGMTFAVGHALTGLHCHTPVAVWLVVLLYELLAVVRFVVVPPGGDAGNDAPHQQPSGCRNMPKISATSDQQQHLWRQQQHALSYTAEAVAEVCLMCAHM